LKVRNLGLGQKATGPGGENLSVRALIPHPKPQRIDLGTADHVRVALLSDPPGFLEVRPSNRVAVCIHVGPPVFASCSHGKHQHRGTAIHGDVDIIPPNTPATWELKGTDVDLVIGVNPALLHHVVADSGRDPRRLEILSRFQVRDQQTEHIGWALKAEMEAGYPCGRAYMDSLAIALATRLVGNHSSLSGLRDVRPGKMPQHKLRSVLSFLEENLGNELPLREIAQVAGLSISHFKSLFRQSVGLSVHQYLIRRRVERAAELLREKTLPIGQVALEVGFCHQSHLAMHMRRILGASPRQVRQSCH
jgi:AraC family transcriptional regulator